MEIEKIAERITATFAQKGHTLDLEEVKGRLSRFINEFGIPPAEAERSLISDFAKRFDTEPMFTSAAPAPSEQAEEEITALAHCSAHDTVNVEGTVTRLFEPRSASVAQSGVLKDASGEMAFTIWANAGMSKIEAHASYRFTSVEISEYNGKLSFKVSGRSTITQTTPVTEIPTSGQKNEPNKLGSARRDGDISLVQNCKPEEWVSLEGVVVKLFEPRSPAISQSGIFSDSSGEMNFTIWERAGVPRIEEGSFYRFSNVVIDEYNNRLSFKVHSGSTITTFSENTPTLPRAQIGEITSGLLTIEGKIISVETPQSESLVQTGIIADESGGIRFLLFKGDGIVPFEDNAWYRIEYASANEYKGSLTLRVSSHTKISKIKEDRALSPSFTPIGELRQGAFSIRGKVVQEWEQNHERLLQAGILGDETGTVRFTIWKDNNMGRLEPDVVYQIYYTNVSIFNDQLSVTLNGSTYLPDEKATITLPSLDADIQGALVSIIPDSGFVKRCPVEGCNLILSRQNMCPEHDIQSTCHYDLRIRGWLDNGIQTWQITLPAEVVTKLTGISMAAAQETAENNPLGPDAVLYELVDMLQGRYLRCTGRIIDNRMFVKECHVSEYDPQKQAELLNRCGANE
jgi:replication factor A1